MINAARAARLAVCRWCPLRFLTLVLTPENQCRPSLKEKTSMLGIDLSCVLLAWVLGSTVALYGRKLCGSQLQSLDFLAKGHLLDEKVRFFSHRPACCGQYLQVGGASCFCHNVLPFRVYMHDQDRSRLHAGSRATLLCYLINVNVLSVCKSSHTASVSVGGPQAPTSLEPHASCRTPEPKVGPARCGA